MAHKIKKKQLSMMTINNFFSNNQQYNLLFSNYPYDLANSNPDISRTIENSGKVKMLKISHRIHIQRISDTTAATLYNNLYYRLCDPVILAIKGDHTFYL